MIGGLVDSMDEVLIGLASISISVSALKQDGIVELEVKIED